LPLILPSLRVRVLLHRLSAQNATRFRLLG
jgi:hypothetical protein